MDINKLIDRVKNLLLTPKTEWPVIAQEPTDLAKLYTGYVMILAAIPAVFAFLGNLFAGLGVVFSFVIMLLGYALTLGMVFVMALIIDALAPSFGAQKDRNQALKTAAYYGTPSWVAGVFAIIPILGLLVMLAAWVYSLIQLYIALPNTMRAPADRAGGYLAVIIVIAIALGLLVWGIIAAVTATVAITAAVLTR